MNDKDRRELDLRVLMLLSALESWAMSLAPGKHLPDHTWEELEYVVDLLKQEVLK